MCSVNVTAIWGSDLEVSWVESLRKGQVCFLPRNLIIHNNSRTYRLTGQHLPFLKIPLEIYGTGKKEGNSPVTICTLTNACSTHLRPCSHELSQVNLQNRGCIDATQ